MATYSFTCKCYFNNNYWNGARKCTMLSFYTDSSLSSSFCFMNWFFQRGLTFQGACTLHFHSLSCTEVDFFISHTYLLLLLRAVKCNCSLNTKNFPAVCVKCRVQVEKRLAKLAASFFVEQLGHLKKVARSNFIDSHKCCRGLLFYILSLRL